MDWIQEEFEALPIPTLPGSSLSVYYDYLNGAPGDGEGEAHGGGAAGDAGDDVTAVDQDALVLDEFGFVQPCEPEPDLDAALLQREEPPQFDETGVNTYGELCRAMGLTPISRFANQLNEGTGTVDLKFYGVTPRAVRAISQALMYNPNAHTLDLTGNWMSDSSAFYLAELLLLENVVLETLVLRGCRLSAQAGALLAAGIELNHSLRRLDLADNQLGDEGVAALQEALGRNDELVELDLSNNNLGAPAAASLGKALLENKTVRVLHLASNNLHEDTPQGLRVLLRSLQQREAFHLLDLAWNALSEPSAVPLKAFLVRGQVEELYLDHNRLPGLAINSIKAGVRKSKTLKHLGLGFNPMEPSDAMNLLLACQGSQTMQTLDLRGIRVNKEFIPLKNRLEETRQMEIMIEGVLSDYEIKGPNLQEMMVRRARFEGFKPKKKKRKKDFGHLLLELASEGKDTLLPEQFTEAALKKKKIKVREELLRAIYEQFQAKKNRVDVSEMLRCYLQLYPDTELPPPVPKKIKKKKHKKKRKKSKTPKTHALKI